MEDIPDKHMENGKETIRLDIADLLEGMWIWYFQGAIFSVGVLIMGIRLIQYQRLERAIRQAKSGQVEHRFLMGITRAFQVDNPVKNREKVDNFVDNYLFIHKLGTVSLKNGGYDCGQVVHCAGLSTLILLGLAFYIKEDWDVIATIAFSGLISTGGLLCLGRILNFSKMLERIRCGLIIHLERERWKMESISGEFEKKRMKAAACGAKTQADQLVRLSREEQPEPEEPGETVAERVAREIMQGKAREESMAERLRKEAPEPEEESGEKIAAGLDYEIPEAEEFSFPDPIEQVARRTVDLAVEKTAQRIRELSTGKSLLRQTKEEQPEEAADKKRQAADADHVWAKEEAADKIRLASTADSLEENEEAPGTEPHLSGHDRQLIRDFLCNLTTR